MVPGVCLGLSPTMDRVYAAYAYRVYVSNLSGLARFLAAFFRRGAYETNALRMLQAIFVIETFSLPQGFISGSELVVWVFF